MNANNSVKVPMLYKERRRPRLVSKNGGCLIQHVHLPHPCQMSWRNSFHLLLEWKWRYILCLFAGSFLISWIFFGGVYYMIFLISNGLKADAVDNQCIVNVNGFVSAFLFRLFSTSFKMKKLKEKDSVSIDTNRARTRFISLESQHTVGYGSRFITEICPSAYLVLCTQLITGVFLQTLLAGMVVAKILRPKNRKNEVRFSQYAVIGPLSEEDRRPTLMIRLADVQHTLYLAESHVRLYKAEVITNRRGEHEFIIRDVDVGYDRGWDRVLLLWPIIIRHVIDEESPLYGITHELLRKSDFELIMTVEGIVETTGMTFQARSSFLTDEILWWHRFVPIVSLNEKSIKYVINYDLFDTTEQIDQADSSDSFSDDKESNYANSPGFV